MRLGKDKEVSVETLEDYCANAQIKVIKDESDQLKDPKMQNIAVLAQINTLGLLPKVKKEHYTRAMNDLMSGNMLDTNLQLFNTL